MIQQDNTLDYVGQQRSYFRPIESPPSPILTNGVPRTVPVAKPFQCPVLFLSHAQLHIDVLPRPRTLGQFDRRFRSWGYRVRGPLAGEFGGGIRTRPGICSRASDRKSRSTFLSTYDEEYTRGIPSGVSLVDHINILLNVVLRLFALNRCELRNGSWVQQEDSGKSARTCIKFACVLGRPAGRRVSFESVAYRQRLRMLG